MRPGFFYLVVIKMADENKPEGSENTDSSASAQQSLDDLTVLSNVSDQSLKGASLNVVRQSDGGGTGGLGNLANVQKSESHDAISSQPTKVERTQDINQDVAAVEAAKQSAKTTGNQSGSTHDHASEAGGT